MFNSGYIPDGAYSAYQDMMASLEDEPAPDEQECIVCHEWCKECHMREIRRNGSNGYPEWVYVCQDCDEEHV